VNSAAGVVRNAVNLGWEEVPLVVEVQRRLEAVGPVLGETPVWVQKDANAAALGEYYFGAARGRQDFVYLSVGSGLGGGIVAAGRLITGADWNAAEVGHLVLDPGGRRCACGHKGCAETIVSGPGLSYLVHLYREEARYPTLLLASATNEQILAAATDGDVLARAALAEVGSWLGQIMAACVALLNPSLFVIGGGLGLAAFSSLIPAARAELERRVLPNSLDALAIEPSQVESSAVGAASLVWYFRQGGETTR
jgi:glucokinase